MLDKTQPMVLRRLIALGIHAFSAFQLSTASATDSMPLEGKFEIYEIRKVTAGITPEKDINKWLGAHMTIEKHLFSVRNERVISPIYRMQRIEIRKSEGEVPQRDTTYFYEVGTERSHICRLLVYRSATAKTPLEQIELLPGNRLAEIYDGRIFFYRASPSALNLTIPLDC